MKLWVFRRVKGLSSWYRARRILQKKNISRKLSFFPQYLSDPSAKFQSLSQCGPSSQFLANTGLVDGQSANNHEGSGPITGACQERPLTPSSLYIHCTHTKAHQLLIMAENYPDSDIFHATFWPQCSSMSTNSLKINFEVSELSEFNGYFAEESPTFASLPEAYISQNSNSIVNDDDIDFIGSNNSFHESSSNNVMPDAVHVITGESHKQNKVMREKIAFKTKSDIEILDDGFKWRKYGKKMMKNSPHPRNYYRCAVEGCPVKKKVDRDREDPQYVITTYEGVHNH